MFGWERTGVLMFVDRSLGNGGQGFNSQAGLGVKRKT
jgi:hypothetical protein